MDSVVTFRILERDIEKIIIPCKLDEELNQIFKRFAEKVYSDICDLEFYYNCKKINTDTTLKKLINNKNIKDIEIPVKKRTNIIKCPICVCNNCEIKVEDYKLFFSKCFHYRKQHEQTKNLLDYETSQKIDFTRIESDDSRCQPKNQNKYLEDFNKCLKCSVTIARYFWHEHSESHTHEKEKLIRYNEKYYYCSKHTKRFISYCNKHKINLWDDCEIEHKEKCGNKIKKFKSFNLNLSKIKEELTEIKEKTDNFTITILDQIKTFLNRANRILEKYQFIANDIIEKYEMNKKNHPELINYQVLKIDKNLSISNKEVLKDLDELNYQNNNDEKENYISKCKKLINIYFGYRDHYIKGSNVNTNNK